MHNSTETDRERMEVASGFVELERIVTSLSVLYHKDSIGGEITRAVIHEVIEREPSSEAQTS